MCDPFKMSAAKQTFKYSSRFKESFSDLQRLTLKGSFLDRAEFDIVRFRNSSSGEWRMGIRRVDSDSAIQHEVSLDEWKQMFCDCKPVGNE